jgi:molybdate transport system substrate-binding protein
MMKQSLVRLLGTFAAASVVTVGGIANAAGIRVVTTGAFQEAFVELAPEFEKSSGHKVAMIAAGTEEITRRLRAGEVLDIVIAPAPAIEGLITQELLLPDSRVEVARSGIGVAIHPGGQRYDISSSAGLRTAVLGAKSIALSSGVSGVYLARLFQQWGIADKIRSKAITLPGAPAVAEAVVRGTADIGFLQISEWLPVKGAEFLGALPADIQEFTSISAGLGKSTTSPEAAKLLLKFLISPEAAPAKRKTGLEAR